MPDMTYEEIAKDKTAYKEYSTDWNSSDYDPEGFYDYAGNSDGERKVSAEH